MTDAVSFVLGSETRRVLLTRLAEGPASSREIVAAAPASESAVYDGLSRLAERELATETESGTWTLTGTGRLVAETVAHCDRVETVVDAAPEYWAHHDVGCLPERFRASIDRLVDCTVVRSPPEDPYRVARRTEEAIRDADAVAVVTPIYSDRYASAYVESEATDRRLVVTPEMVERLLRDQPPGPPTDAEELNIRVHPSSMGLTVTDSDVRFALPDCEGNYDADTAVTAESPDAIAWGRQLFDHYWSQATPAAEWIATELPELADAENSPASDDASGDASGERTDSHDGAATADESPVDGASPRDEASGGRSSDRASASDRPEDA